MLLASLVAIAGCRAISGGAAPSLPAPTTAAPVSVSGDEAPEACGFPAGTALEYAGRSTTAQLDVQEVVGDPMSDDPADIYITRDKFDQGALHGRLVCAIFVNDPGFVEITVHPDDGGRVEPPTPQPSATPPPNGIAEDEAVDIARGTLEEADEWEIFLIDSGPIDRVFPHVLEDPYYEWARDLLPDRWVWLVFFVRGDEGIHVIVDFLDGSVLGTAESIVN